MLTNNDIERELQNNSLWFHRNNYFEAKVRDLPEDPSGIRCTEKRFVINATENDIIFVPVNAITNSSLDADQKTNICSGDITKIEVRQEYTKYVLVCTKDTGDIFKIIVDAYADKVQLDHIIAFVETFKNVNINLLYALKRDDVREAMNNIHNGQNSDTKTTVSTSEFQARAEETINNAFNKIENAQKNQAAIGPILVIIFFFFFFIPIFGTIVSIFGEVADHTFPIFAVIPFVFLFFFVFIFITIIKNAMKNRDDIMDEGPGRVTYDYKEKQEPKSPRGPMTQEKMENIREKIDEEMVTSNGPINSHDSDFGGIKKY